MRAAPGLPAQCTLLRASAAALPALATRLTPSLHPTLPTHPAQWACLPSVLALADYLGASGILARADAWLCEQCRTQGATDRLQSLLCDAFELAARHRLGSAMALLLPYATQALARGSRALSAVWCAAAGGLAICSVLRLACYAHTACQPHPSHSPPHTHAALQVRRQAALLPPEGRF